MIPSPSRVVSAFIRLADATPLPPTFSPTEIGLMTAGEFLDLRNPEGKHHPSDSYNTTLKTLNEHLTPLGYVDYDRKIHAWRVLGDESSDTLFIRQDDTVVGVLHNGTLFHSTFWKPTTSLSYMSHRREWESLPVTATRLVKYITEYVSLVSRVAERNRKKYSHVIQNIVVKGAPYQIRSDGVPKPDEGTTLAILNSKGEVVAMASDEWGATLIRVPDEYRGSGFGQILGKVWYELNPSYESGGFTPSGEKNALKMWEHRVREFLDRGWYTALVRAGRLTIEKVNDILSGLSGHRETLRLPDDTPTKESKPDLRYMIEPDQYFLVYDSRALEGNENDYPDEKYILAHGLFRSSESVGMFLFGIDYDRPYQKLATAIALQMARDMGEPLYVGKGYTDIVEWENIPGVVKEGDYIRLTRDVLPIRDMARLEVLQRKPVDRYGQRHNLLLEAADLKWR